MYKYNVTGMDCAACAAHVEKAVKSVKGVTACTVNLFTNSMTVEGTAKPDSIISAVQKAGYGASLEGGGKQNHAADKTKDTSIAKRLISSVVFLLILMYLSMGYTMFSAPLPAVMAANPVIIAVAQLLLSGIVMIINQKFFVNGFKGIINRSPNMDTLVALGSAAAFIYSTSNLFIMSEHLRLGNIAASAHLLHDLYFEAAAMILVIITVGKLLEARSKGKTTSAIEALVNMTPKTATLIIDGKEVVKNAEEVLVGDIFIVRPGESIPADGVIIEGASAVNEATLTGESIPVDKAEGDKVSAATINQSGFIKCRAVGVGEDTSFARIIKLVSDAASTKAPIGKIADKVSGIFVPVVLALSLITFIVWMIIGETVGFSLARAISVLVISCPCALGLATPVAIMVGSGRGAKNGILYKTAEVLEKTAKAKTVCFDKTGTITVGCPEVTDIIPFGITETELLEMAVSLESKSEHPLARAILEKSEDSGITPFPVTDFKAVAGGGIEAKRDDTPLFAGNYKFINSKAQINTEIKQKAEALMADGKTPMFFASGNTVHGIIAVADTIKRDTATAVEMLKKMGIETVMLTGDNLGTATAIAKAAGIKTVYAELLPEDKNTKISELKQNGTVIMVGDGINDAPALTTADIGIAVGAGSDVAIDAADIVLVNDSITYVPAAIKLSRRTLSTIHGNLFWAFFYNVLCIPLAAGVFVKLLGFTVSPMLAAAAMCLSDICVVSNALKLNFVNIFDKKEKRKMKKTLIIEGMMCPHCENRVKTLLEGVSGVDSAEVSHKAGTATVSISDDISDDILISTVTNGGYKVTGIK